MIAAFFFSSRRRHTRYWRDWSSDVCSSDLAALQCISAPPHPATTAGILSCSSAEHDVNVADSSDSCARLPIDAQVRSEERRVGKECSPWWGRNQDKKRRGRVQSGGACATAH